jgi:hypothetical protein
MKMLRIYFQHDYYNSLAIIDDGMQLPMQCGDWKGCWWFDRAT